MAKTATPIPPPTPIALVVCDNVYTESGGKRALVGVFNQIIASKFPAFHHRLCVFVSVTSLRPQTKCKLDIVNGETDVAIVSMEGPMPMANPTTVCDVVFELRNIAFPEAGTYYFRFWGNESLIVQRPIDVIAPPQPQDKGETDNAKH